VNSFTLGLPPRGKPSTHVDCCKRQRGITANQRFALRGSMNRKNQSRSKLRGMDPVAIQAPSSQPGQSPKLSVNSASP